MTRLLIILFLALYVCSTFAVSSITPKFFSPEDANAFGITIDMDLKDVQKVLGHPDKKESHYEGAFGANVINYYYKFGNVRFEPLDGDKYSVSEMTIDRPGYTGPRNIKVGDSLESVLIKFPYNKNAIIDENGERFVYGKRGVNFGCLMYESGKITYLVYCYGGGGFGSYSLGMDIVNNKVKTVGFGVMNV